MLIILEEFVFIQGYVRLALFSFSYRFYFGSYLRLLTVTFLFDGKSVGKYSDNSLIIHNVDLNIHKIV